MGLPFLTVTHLWTDEHPDPDEDCLRGVLDTLQARWEDFAERDVGIFLDNTLLPSEQCPQPKIDAVLWLVTAKVRAVSEAEVQAADATTAERMREADANGADNGTIAAVGGAPTTDAAPAKSAVAGAPSSDGRLTPGGEQQVDAPASARSGSSQGGTEDVL